MYIPESPYNCITALEKAGFPTYCVGGCVRDSLLGLTPQDYDLCTAATPDEIRQVFHDRRLILAGEKHGTVSVITDQGPVEITTFRTEGDYQDNRHPGWVRFVPTIEEDLSRRDFTVNAMAYSPTRGFADPWGGQKDLKDKCLRAVGDPDKRFAEDSLRILRGLRFAARYGLTIEENTFAAMLRQKHLMDNLARERVFSELCKLLLVVDASRLVAYAPLVAQIIPELEPAIGFDQHSPHHAYDIFTHIAHVVEAAPKVLHLRLAALLHDVGKVPTYAPDETGRGHFYGHAKVGAQMANDILLRLKAPTALRQQVVDLIGRHMILLEPDKKLLRRRLSQYGPEGTLDLLELQKADFGSKGVIGDDPDPCFGRIRQYIDELLDEDACLTVRDLAIDGDDLIALGFAPGKAIGTCLNHLLRLVLEEALPNEKEPLTAQAVRYLKEESQ